MNKVILYIATSLDGFIADIQGGVDWLPQPNDPEDSCGFQALMKRINHIIMGRKSYEQILTFGPWAWMDKKTYVFTSKSLENKNLPVDFTDKSPKNFMTTLQNDQNIWLLGGANLSHSFFKERLADEIILTIIPVYLKEGIALHIPYDDFYLTEEKKLMDGIVQKIYHIKKTQI